jgi:hypothetical protein
VLAHDRHVFQNPSNFAVWEVAMAKILCIHGIGQQLKGERIVVNEWRDALRDGMSLAGANSEELPGDQDITVSFYGDLFREESTKGFEESFRFADINEGLEADLVRAWLQVAKTTLPSDGEWGPNADLKSGWQRETVQRLAVALLSYRFFADLSEKFFVGALKQVTRYFGDADIRRAARQRFATHLTGETRLVIAHSLGSVVAYEALCQAESKLAPTFITLGSPLGLPNLIFDRLQPAPTEGKGVWPGGVRSWTNISDPHDIVAAVKELSTLFAGVRDLRVSNEALAHDVSPYLTAKTTGAVIWETLRV